MGSDNHQNKLKEYLKSFNYQKELANIKKNILFASHKLGIKAIRIGGSEPSNHPNLKKIIEFSKKLGFKDILLQTNGIRFADPTFTNEIKKAGLTGTWLPIYGSGKIHDAIVNVPGASNSLMKAFKNLTKHDIKIQFHTLLLKQNYASIHHLIKIFPDIKIGLPRFSSKNPQTYKKFCIKLTDIPPSLYKNLTLTMPCLYKKKANFKKIFNQEITYTPESGFEKYFKRMPQEKLTICALCKLSKYCIIFDPLYFKYFGEEMLMDIIHPRSPSAHVRSKKYQAPSNK